MNNIHIVSYSGGVGSAITAKMIVDRYGKDNVKLLFADTKVENPDLYRFNADIEKLLDLKIQIIAEGRTPWQIFNDSKFIGNTRIDPCSRILKRDFIRSWLVDNYPFEKPTIWIGIDASETHRLHPVVERNKPYVYRSILVEERIMLTNIDKIQWCEKNGIIPSKLYTMGFGHDNCGGFCVKAGLGHFKKLWELLPEVYLQNECEEQLAYANNPSLRPFLRKTINGKIRYLTMKQYREWFLEGSGITEEESLEFGGCGCAL